MERNEILERAGKKKALIGEMEKTKTGKANWIANIAACVLAVALIIAEGFQGHFTGVYALASVCYIWATVFYFCQYFVAKRPWQVLIGAVLHGLAGLTMLTFYVLRSMGVV